MDALNEINLSYDNDSKSYKGQVTGLNQNGQYQLVAFASLNDGTGFISTQSQ